MLANSSYFLNKKYNKNDHISFEQLQKIPLFVISKVNNGDWNWFICDNVYTILSLYENPCVEHLLHSLVYASASYFSEECGLDEIEVKSFDGQNDSVQQDLLTIYSWTIVSAQKDESEPSSYQQHDEVPHLWGNNAKQGWDEIESERVPN